MPTSIKFVGHKKGKQRLRVDHILGKSGGSPNFKKMDTGDLSKKELKEKKFQKQRGKQATECPG